MIISSKVKANFFSLILQRVNLKCSILVILANDFHHISLSKGLQDLQSCMDFQYSTDITTWFTVTAGQQHSFCDVHHIVVWCFLRMCGDTVMDAKNSEVRKQRGRFFGIFRFHMPNAKCWQEELTNIHLCHFNIYGRIRLIYNPEPLNRFKFCSITIRTYIIATAFPTHLCLFVTLVFPGRQYFWHYHHFLWQYHRGILT